MFRILCSALILGFAVGCDGNAGGLSSDPPSRPVMEAPADGATNVENAVALQWKSLDNAASYHVQASTDTNFDAPFFDQRNILSPLQDLKELEVGKTYFWRIRGVNEFGEGDWSDTWSFTPASVARLPSPPTLVAPENGVENLPTAVRIEWQEANNARSYHLQVSVESVFIRNEVDMQDIRGSYQDVSRLVPTYIYFWRVRSNSPAGFGPWSPTRSFIVEGVAAK